MVVFEVLQQIYQILGGITPAGADPLLFLGTFFIIFGVLFVALSKVLLFKEDQYRAIRVIIALALAYFAASSLFVTTVFTKLFPNFAVAVVAIVIFMVVLGMLGVDLGNKTGWLVVLIVIWWVASSTTTQLAPFIPGLAGLPLIFGGVTTTDLIIIVGVILILFFIAGGKDKIKGLID
jgi:hypothetical protein